MALQRLGELEGALRVLEEVLDTYRGVPDGDVSMRRAARLMPRHDTSSDTSGERAFVLRGLGAMASELRDT